MLKIGDFSKICQTSVKALRHWDAIGLLKPALIDPETNYRYYSIGQIDDVNRILAFRTLGLSLSETAQLLHAHPSADDIRAMLVAKRTEVMAEIEQSEATLKALEGRLRVMDRLHKAPNYEVVLKSSEEVPLLAVRTVVPNFEVLVNLLEESYRDARQKDGTNLLAIWHDDGYEVETVDVEVGFPVESRASKPIALKHNLQLIPSVLPAVPLIASTIHLGEWLTLSEAYIHLGQWIDQNGYAMAGAGRELFHYIDWEDNQRATVTELQFPIVERSTA